MICPNCRHENKPAAKFCTQCRTKLERRCPDCGAAYEAGDRFCGECGADLPGAPPAAASSVAAPPPSLEAQFASLQQAMPASLRQQLLTEPEGENRLVTVLFADMSGSVARTAGLHPEEAADLVNRLLKSMVDVLVKYDGRVDRFLGDGVLAVFGAPRARENDPERAILAALEIREAARELELRVTAGINTGAVYVGEVGSEQHQERTVMGPAVNLAARLQGKAEAGQILVGAATYRHTRRAFAFTPLSLEIKGLDSTIAAYAVERALPRPEKVRGIEGLRADLIGREEELRQLTDALAALRQGRGQVVCLIGEAGVGKSRLVSELQQAIGVPSTPSRSRSRSRSRKLTDENENENENEKERSGPKPLWLEGRCLELGMTASYWPFIDLLREYFAFGPEEDDRQRGMTGGRGGMVARLRELVEHGDLSAERMEEIGPVLGHLLSVRLGTDWDQRLQHAGPEQIKQQTFSAVRDFLAALARRQPVVLALEDLHWADSLSLDLISLLMDTLTRDPLLLLCVYRPERDHKCWHLATLAGRKCPDRYTPIELRELTPVQSRRLVEALLAIDNLPTAVKEMILAKARGNPFFVEEVVRSLIDAGMVYREDGIWRAKAGIEQMSVPETVQSVILSRVDRLEPELKRVLESASVIGRLFRRRLLEKVVASCQFPVASESQSHLLTTDHWSLATALWELEERQLIYEERIVPEEEYSFQHVLTQETIYESILRRRRSRFHQQVAEAIEALYQEGLDEFYEQLAYHYERTGSDEKAIEYLLKAGEKALRAFLKDDAWGYFRRAMERLERTGLAETRREWKLQALDGLAMLCEWGSGTVAEGEAYRRQALALGKQIAVPPQELGRLYWGLGGMLWVQGRYDEMIQLAEEAIGVLGQGSETVEAALINDLLGLAYASQGKGEEGYRLWLRTAPFLERLPYQWELIPVHEHVAGAYLFLHKEIEEARRWYRILEKKARQHRDPGGAQAVVYNVGRYLTRPTGDLKGAVAQFQHGLELARKNGDLWEQARSLYDLAATFLQLGELEQARQSVRDSLDLMESIGHQGYIGTSYQILGTALLGQGRLSEASEAFATAEQVWQARGAPGLDEAFARGRIYQAQGHHEAAVKQYQELAALVPADPPRLARALAALEAAMGDPEAFRAFCRTLRQEHPEAAGLPFSQWFLEPDQPDCGLRAVSPGDGGSVCADEGRRSAPRECTLDCGLSDNDEPGRIEPGPSLSPDPQSAIRNPQSENPQWHDPFADCAFTAGQGLEIRAANGRDLWRLNVSAPRLLGPAAGAIALQMVCAPVSAARPAIGGLLLWKDKADFLRLERGTRGRGEISFEGCLGNQEVILGRGHLPSERIFLRLERREGHVRALCSADGKAWLTVGHAQFPAEDPVQIGLHAIGQIDRLVYPGAYAEGTAIRFETFALGA